MPTDVQTPQSGQAAPLSVLDLESARRWAGAARALLATQRKELDSLNVFPVPDGDTGTNMFLTLDGALDALRSHDWLTASGRYSLVEGFAVLARSTLMSARGNSGVILSQLVRGLAEAVREAPESDESGIDAATLADGFRRASERARQGVSSPVEGTILSVATAAAEGAQQGCDAGGTLLDVVEHARTAALEALQRTPDQLDALHDAGVVDAGGAGYVLVLEALVRVISGDESEPVLPWRGANSGSAADRAQSEGAKADAASEQHRAPCAHDGDGWVHGPAYEVMYLLSGTDDAAVESLRHELEDLGDSVVVAGDGEVWTVHVHTDDTGAAVQAGLRRGETHQVRVSDLRLIGGAESVQDVPVGATGTAVVACAEGEGIAQVLRAAGAGVLADSPTQRCSTGEILAAARASGARTVIVLPNDQQTGFAAEAAAESAREDGLDVRVVPTRSIVQGVAALAVYDQDASADDAVEQMSAACEATRFGSVGVAPRAGRTEAGRCRKGDYLGVVDGRVRHIGRDASTIAGQVLHLLIGASSEVVTLVVGAGAPQGLAQAVASAARMRHRGVDVAIIEAGDTTVPLVVGVE